ncbi:hypothetical protein [Gilliamella sp. CG25]|uniref:hypothetical protein n=1 Tax=unclassified Gilliamella TaxID=2685620 RepID=UPI0039881280
MFIKKNESIDFSASKAFQMRELKETEINLINGGVKSGCICIFDPKARDRRKRRGRDF